MGTRTDSNIAAGTDERAEPMTDRWHNILAGAEWDRLKADFETLHKRADEAGFVLIIQDEKCPRMRIVRGVGMDPRPPWHAAITSWRNGASRLYLNRRAAL